VEPFRLLLSRLRNKHLLTFRRLHQETEPIPESPNAKQILEMKRCVGQADDKQKSEDCRSFQRAKQSQDEQEYKNQSEVAAKPIEYESSQNMGQPSKEIEHRLRSTPENMVVVIFRCHALSCGPCGWPTKN